MITLDRLKELFSYNPTDGVFIRIMKTAYNSHVGDVAGTTDKYGNVKIGIDGKIYHAHRLAWLYMNGVNPTGYISHIDGDLKNNRIKNLSLINYCVVSEADINKRGSISFHKTKKRWQTRMYIFRKHMYIGDYHLYEDAVSGLEKFKIELIEKHLNGNNNEHN